MTPAGHIAEAEQALSRAADQRAAGDSERATLTVLQAIAHTLIAVAVELGAPHPAAPAGGEQGATQAPPG